MMQFVMTAAFVLSVFAAPLPVGQTPNLACTFQRGGGVADGPRQTFENVTDRAVAIVEATVRDVTPPPPRPAVPVPGGAVPAADIVLATTRVLKGSDTLKQVAVSQIGAMGLFEFKVGQRYILFLNNPDPRAAGRFPDRPGVPRFTAVAPATMCVEGNIVHVSENGNFLRSRFDGMDLEKVVAEIRSYVNR
jgi:hypothetical protein